MKKKLVNNWLMKILSLLIAFTLWLVVINIDDPVDTDTFTNIKVNFLNTNVLTDENRVYEVLDGTNVVRSVKVEAPRSVLEKLSEGDIVAEADFSKVTVNETIEINFYSTRFKDEIKSIKGSIDMVKLSIEDKKTKRFVLAAETAGTPEEGYIVGNPVMDQNRIEVSGPESVVSKITNARLKVDVTDSNSDISTYADVILYDAEGNIVTSPSLVMNTDSVKVRVPILATKEVPLIYSVAGKPAEGYLTTGAVESDPETVLLAGTAATLSVINSITIPETELDVTDRTTDLITFINLKEYLPDNVILAGDFNGRVKVTVPIEAEAERELTIAAQNLHIVGLPEGYTAKLDGDITQYKVTIRGLKATLDEIDQNLVKGYIQFDNLMESQGIVTARPGAYLATVDFGFGEGIIQKSELQVNLIVEKLEEAQE